MNTNKQYQHDLVTEDYYKQELAFQKEIDAEKNAKTLNINITIKKINEGLLVVFPEDKEYTKISGTIALYRPSNKKLDFEIPIELNGSKTVIPAKHLIEGRWKITIDWKYHDTSYMFKKSFTY